MMEILFRGVDKHYNIATGWSSNVWRTGSLIEYDSGQSAITAIADRHGRCVFSHEVIPETHRNGHQTPATLGLMLGFALMMVLDTTLG